MSRNTHERGDSWHRGSLRATLVDVGGQDLETWLRGVWDRIVALEVATPIPTPSFSLDSIVQRAMSGSSTLDSILSRSIAGASDLDAVLRRTFSDSFLLDAVLRLGGFSFTADAILKSEIFSTFPLEAIKQAVITGNLPLDAVLKSTISSSLTADAVLKAVISGSLTLDAVLKALGYSFVLDAQIQKSGIVRPTSDVTSSGTVTTNAGSSTWYDKIDETTNSNADWVGTRTSSLAYFIVGCGSLSLSGNYIQRIVVSWRGTNSAPSSAVMPIIRNPATGTTYDLGSSIAQGGTSADNTAYVRPWDSQPWEPADVNALEIGHRSAFSGPYNNRCGSMWVTIYYQ